MSIAPAVVREKKLLLDESRMKRALRRMAADIVQKHNGVEDLFVIGIRSRGVPLGRNIVAYMEKMEGLAEGVITFGALTITLYRDDLSTIAPEPVIQPSRLPEPVDDKRVILIDDVLYTGRTVRAALDALVDYGRPAGVELAVLIDRGHRELPIHADYIGKTVPTDANEIIKVKCRDLDGEDAVYLLEK